MADGTFTQNVAEDGTITYESEEKNGALTITTEYDADFNVTDTTIEKDYENIRNLEDMPEDFQTAWAAIKGNLPASFTAPEQVVQFGDDRNNIVVIATKDVGDVVNGDVLGRINSWDNQGNEGTWQRWVNDDVVDVQNYEWSYNFHDKDWNRIAEYGEREISLDLEDGLVLDETGTRLSSTVRKADVDAATWTEITKTISADQMKAIADDASWDDVEYVDIQQNSWAAVENLYREADELWSDSEEQILVHGTIGDDDNTVFFGSIAKRDGFIVVRDNQWNEVARLTDPANAMSYAEVKALVGDAFDTAWDKIGDALPDTFKSDGSTNEANLLYNVDKWGNILVFDTVGVMIGEIHNWGHTDTWDRPWDDEYPSETYENVSFHFRTIESDENGDTWTDIGRYEEGSNVYHAADGGADLLDRSWEQVSSTVYERKASDADWAKFGTDYLSDLIATTLDITWDDVDQLEISENTHTHYPNEWRESTDTDVSESVRFFAEIPMNDGDWYVTQFLGGAEKRGGFIEIYGSDWDTIARVADPEGLLTWDEVKAAQGGLEQAWDDVEIFLPTEIADPTQLKYSTDDNNIYAFTAAGAMAAQINYWNDTHEWEGWFDGQVLPVKNVNYNYNFHDAQWNSIANAGGFDRYIVEDDGNLVHDETGTNIGVQVYKDAVSDAVWQEYDPNDTTGTLAWDDVTEVRYQIDSWEAISNDYRYSDWGGMSTQTRIEYFEEVEDRGWSQFVGVVEKRDGYIEIRDDDWNLVAQKIDPDASASETSYTAMLLKYGSDFKDAWDKVADSLPSVFKDDGGATNQENFLYATDKWDNILVFDTDGTLIGQINYWSSQDTWDRTWDNEYTSETHENTSFNFSVIELSNGGRDVIDVARYEVGSNTLIKPDTSTDVDRSWEQTSATLYERQMSPEDWAAAESDYFLDALTEYLGFTWDDVDKVEVGTRERTEYAVRWRTEEMTSTEQRIEFIREVEMNDGDWYAHDFLGSIEYREGFIEIRDGDWETVARIVDPSNSKTFAEVLKDHPKLDWAWDEVKYSLPDSAQDRDALSFTTGGEYDPIGAFDASGAMVLQIGKWNWEQTHEFGDITEEEYGYGYNFNGEHWERYAQADINERYVSNDSNDPALDHTWQSVSTTVRKEDLSDTAWAEYNPNDTTGTIIWDDIVELSVGVNEWQSHANWDRTSDDVYSGDEERIEYFVEVSDAWSTWTERVAITEREGNLMTVRDRDWNVVDQIVSGDAESVPLSTVLDAADQEILKEYGDIVAKYFDVDALQFIESTSGPGIIMLDGAIVATVERYENYENDDTELYYNYDIRDTQGENLLRLGGWSAIDKDGNVLAKPNGVQIGEFFYKDDFTDLEWEALEQEVGITWEGFDWDDVGVVEKRMWRNDWNSSDSYEERNEVQFIQVDPSTGRENWDYFNAVFEGAMVTVKDGNWNTLGSYLNENAGITKITDLNDFSAGFLGLVDDAEILDGHFSSDKLTFYTDDATGELLVSEEGIGVVVKVEDVTAEWAAEYGDTVLGYEFRTADGDYMGWHWKSTPSTSDDPFVDGADNDIVGATKIASNMRFDLREGSDLSPHAIGFLNHVFKPNVGVSHEFYDLDYVWMRLEEWVDDATGDTVGKNVLIQHNLAGEDGWSIRTGFDLLNSKAVSSKRGEDPVFTDTSLDMAEVQEGIDAFIQHAHYDAAFPDDLAIFGSLYPTIDNPLIEIQVSASDLMDGEDALELIYDNASSQSDVETWSLSDSDKTLTVEVTDGATKHTGVVSSTEDNFGQAIKTYVDANGLGLIDFLDDLEGVVAEALGEDNLDGVAYTATYTFDDDATDQTDGYEVLGQEVSDAGKLWDYSLGGDDEDMYDDPPMDDSISNTSPVDDSGKIIVTVGQHEGSNKFLMGGQYLEFLELKGGETYVFDQSDTSNGENGGHPLKFSTVSDGTHNSGVEYTTGVTAVGTPGQAGASTTIVLAADAPPLYVYCSQHSGMGFSIGDDMGHGDSMSMDDLPFIIDSTSMSMVTLYTPDDAVLLEVMGLEPLAQDLIDDGDAVDFDDAMPMALEGFLFDFMGDDEPPIQQDIT